MNKTRLRVSRRTEMLIVGCVLASCFFTTGCFEGVIGGLGRTSQTWIAGGGFLDEITNADPNPTGLAVDTRSMVALGAPGLSTYFLGGFFGGYPPPPTLVYVAPNGAGVNWVDTSKLSSLPQPQNISTGSHRVSNLARNGSTVYATHPDDSAISVITLAKGSQNVNTLPTPGRKPDGIAVSYQTPYTYVISGNDVVKLEIGSSAIADHGSVSIPEGASDIGVGSGYVVVPNFANDIVYVFADSSSASAPKQLAAIQIDNGSPNSVAVSPDAAKAYVTIYTGSEGMDPGFVDVIDLKTFKVTSHYNVGACPTPIALTQSSGSGFFGTGTPSTEDSLIYVGNQCDNTVSVLSASDGTGHTYPVQGVPNAIASE
ncbi:MAG TPA: hypothetical protein VFA04_16260 [Bryobacteraceae bacterium]|nr:hypothetical protein [Bryobacteraceae bacterium]